MERHNISIEQQQHPVLYLYKLVKTENTTVRKKNLRHRTEIRHLSFKTTLTNYSSWKTFPKIFHQSAHIMHFK